MQYNIAQESGIIFVQCNDMEDRNEIRLAKIAVKLYYTFWR
jgi:hypothetical protein